jgi:hypothetical protein
VAAIPPLPPNPPTFITPGPDPLLFLPGIFRGRPGEIITVPVLLDRSEGLEAVDLALSYDLRRLELLGVERGSLTVDFDLMLAHVDRQSGTLRVGLSRSAGPIADRGSGSVVLLTFRIWADARAGRAVINLQQRVGQTTTQLNEGGLDLNPDPSDRAGDALDGNPGGSGRPAGAGPAALPPVARTARSLQPRAEANAASRSSSPGSMSTVLNDTPGVWCHPGAERSDHAAAGSHPSPESSQLPEGLPGEPSRTAGAEAVRGTTGGSDPAQFRASGSG